MKFGSESLKAETKPWMRYALFGFCFLTISSAPLTAETSATRINVEVDGIQRFALVHAPSHWDHKTKLPVVLIFHGGLRDAASAEMSFGFDEVADENQFFAVYPNGMPRPGRVLKREHELYWNSSESFFTSNTDDEKFVSVLLDDLAAQFPYRAEAVFATGFSNGAQMSYHLGCDMADRIAAIAPVSGSLETPHCAPSKPVPVLDIHGTADPMVPFNGHGFLGFHSVPWTLEQWASFNQCNGTVETELLPVKVQDGTSVKVVTYQGCQQSQLISVQVNNGGHQWPGLTLTPPYLYGEKISNPLEFFWLSHYLGKNSQNLSATAYIWQFFSKLLN